MDDLEFLRNEIDRIDKELVNLFEKRMDIVLKMVEYKRKNNLDIYDKSREEEVIEKNLLGLKNKSYKKYLKEFIQETMNISKKLQRDRF